jgi:hypothetical protein
VIFILVVWGYGAVVEVNWLESEASVDVRLAIGCLDVVTCDDVWS